MVLSSGRTPCNGNGTIDLLFQRLKRVARAAPGRLRPDMLMNLPQLVDRHGG
jgi:hypothetical protein